MDQRFYDGILGCSTKVCGYKVDALTPWHHLLLNVIESPILGGSGNADTYDLLVFLKITQAKWPEQPSFKLKLRDFIWLGRMKLIKQAKKEMAKLKTWLGAKTSYPKLWEKEQGDNYNSGRRISSPPIFMFVVGLTSKGGLRLSEAWN